MARLFVRHCSRDHAPPARLEMRRVDSRTCLRERAIPTDRAALRPEACARGTRHRSPAEWAQHLPGRPHRATCPNRPQPPATGGQGLTPEAP